MINIIIGIIIIIINIIIIIFFSWGSNQWEWVKIGPYDQRKLRFHRKRCSKKLSLFLRFNIFCCFGRIYRVEITFEVGVQKSKQLTGPNHHHTPKVFQSKVLPVASEIKSYVRHMSPSTEIQIQKYKVASETESHVQHMSPNTEIHSCIKN